MPAEAEQPELNANQAAFMQFLQEHYSQQGKPGQLDELDPDDKDFPEAARRILEEAAEKGGPPPAGQVVQGKSVMCIKSWDEAGKKVFLNLGRSDKVDAPELVMKDGEEQTRLPMSLGPPFEDVDAKGEPCLVFDVLFHPSTLDDAQSPAFLRFLVEMVFVRIEQKHTDLPKINQARRFKKLRQKNFKGRQLAEQMLAPQPLMRSVDEESGLRDFSGPALAEPAFSLDRCKRRCDGASVVRLRVELPGVAGHEIELRLGSDTCRLLVPGKYESSMAVEPGPGMAVLSVRFHEDNHTLTVVWGPEHAKQYDEEQKARRMAELKELEEAQRIQLTNDLAFELVDADY